MHSNIYLKNKIVRYFNLKNIDAGQFIIVIVFMKKFYILREMKLRDFNKLRKWN